MAVATGETPARLGLGGLLRETARLLLFRAPGPLFHAHPRAFLAFGLACTWLAGIGRYWDHPRARLWQYAGLGSVAYVFVLALVLWGALSPLAARPRRIGYLDTLRFVTLTSPPALLYALPVERVMTVAAAASTNAWFLAIVAAWRVGLLVRFARQGVGLPRLETLAGCLLPLALIVFALAVLNLEHVVFNIMAGIVEPDARRTAYELVLVLAWCSMVAAPVLLLLWLGLAVRAARARRRARPDAP